MRAAISSIVLSVLVVASTARAQTPAAADSGSPVAPDSACGAVQFADEVVMGVSRTHLCPKPVDPTLELLSAKLERSPSKNTGVFFEVLRELRDHCHAQAHGGTAPHPLDWRAALARDIDEALAQAKGRQHPSAGFAAVRGAQANVDPDACLFMTSEAGEPDYTCYVIQGSPAPEAPAKSSMLVIQLADFADAYLAHRALAIAYSALVKLDLPALDVAIKRLELAEQRWESLRKQGYLQYPWELALSSVLASYRDYQACFASDAYCTGEEGLDPERTRLIALHPGVGMGFSGFGKNAKPSADAALALSLELVGVTLYADDFKTYFGASLGAVVNDGDFRDLRPGVFVHLTRWLHVGYLMSLFRSATRYDATLFLSSDLGTAFGADFFD